MMLNFLKRIFNRGSADSQAPAAADAAAPAHVPKPRAAEKPVGGGVEVAKLSIRAILEKLPPDLRAMVNQMPDPEVKIVLPVNTILKQLPAGAVKMSLASLLRQAPHGTFRTTSVEEKQMVDVPLAEVFKCVDASRLGRRSDQRQYDLPDDAAGLFGRNGSARSVTAPAAAKVASQGESAETPVPAAAPPVEPVKVVKMPALAPVAKIPANGNGHPAPAKASVSMPKAAAAASQTGELVISFVELAAGWPEGIRGELSHVAGDTKLVIPASAVSAGLQKGRVAFPWSQVRMWFRPVLAGPTGIAEDIELIFPLRIMAPAFVAATGATKRSEGAQIDHSLPDFFGPASKSAPKVEQPAVAAEQPAAAVEQPAAAVEATAEAVLRPTDPAEESARLSPAPAGDVPLFKLVREEPVPVVVEAEPAAPVADAEPAAHAVPTVSVPQASSAVESSSSPANVVARACELPGVSGAVVALEEGLVVAQKLPPGLSADTFAAFMPQIFGRLEKYTVEMQLGAATGITIETAHGPCHIARVGKIYFGTVGRAGERLPDALCNLTGQLAAHSS